MFYGYVLLFFCSSFSKCTPLRFDIDSQNSNAWKPEIPFKNTIILGQIHFVTNFQGTLPAEFPSAQKSHPCQEELESLPHTALLRKINNLTARVGAEMVGLSGVKTPKARG